MVKTCESCTKLKLKPVDEAMQNEMLQNSRMITPPAKDEHEFQQIDTTAPV